MGKKLQATGSHTAQGDRTVLTRTVLVALAQNRQALGISLGDKVKEKSAQLPSLGNELLPHVNQLSTPLSFFI